MSSNVSCRSLPENGTSDEFIENFVCNENEINENEMKQFDFGDSGKILLIKQHGQLSAIGSKCSHYGAPLATGALGDGRVRCPWHGACFNIKTGDIEDFPGPDSIPCYKVSVENGKVKIRAKRKDFEKNGRSEMLVKRIAGDERTFIVVGGGPSGAICVKTLRENGFTGRLILICKENVLPYDRIKFSKIMNLDVSKALLKPQEFYDNYDIETMLGVAANALNSQTKELSLTNGYKIKFDKMYIATGCNARKLNLPGSDLPQVVTLRNASDANYIHSELGEDKHLVILGVSFIGLEAAASSVSKVKRVTVIGRDSVPLKPVFGEQIGQKIMDWFKEKGVHFSMNNSIKRCISENNKLTSVELDDGEILKADICIMGVGSTLNTEFLKNSGINMNPNGSVDTDLYLETNVRDIFVGGDIANAPVFSLDQTKKTIGHFGLAQYHGKIAALNMLSKRTALAAVPFFWTQLFGTGFRYAGHGSGNNVQIVGDLDNLKFIAFYFDENEKVVAMGSCGKDPVVSQFAEFLSQGRKLYKNQLHPDPLAWVKELTQ